MLKPLLAAAVLLTPASALAQAAPCAGPEHRQFDFWVGHWQVTRTGEDRVVAESLIESLYGGCAVRENWMPRGQPGGGSLNAYVPREHGWRQSWIGADGSWVEFKGGWTGAAMVLIGNWPGADGKPREVRTTYSRAADGSVRQRGEESRDDGKTWGPTFDFTYRRLP